MSDLITFITGGSETFTPSVMVGLIVFCMIVDALCMMLSAVAGGFKQ